MSEVTVESLLGRPRWVKMTGWVLLAVFGASADSRWAPLYWTLLSVGTAFLGFVLVGVVMYLTLSVEATGKLVLPLMS